MAEAPWIVTEVQYPEPGTKVEWISPHGGTPVQGFMAGRLWHIEGGMYVYYTPKFWRPRG